MKQGEVMNAIQHAAFGSTLGALRAPTDAQIRMLGECAALAILKSDPAIESAEYDHATHSIRVRFTAAASGFPCVVMVSDEAAFREALKHWNAADTCEALASRDPGQVRT